MQKHVSLGRYLKTNTFRLEFPYGKKKIIIEYDNLICGNDIIKLRNHGRFFWEYLGDNRCAYIHKNVRH